MAMQLSHSVDFDRMALLLERMRVTEANATRWTAAYDELRGIVSAQLDTSARQDNDNVIPIDSLTSAA